MTIRFVRGDIFESDCEALVNPVNCIGVMGAGLALQFKKRYPIYFEKYRAACRLGWVEPRFVWIYETGYCNNPKLIVSFPTKIHWENPSHLHWINYGLKNLAWWIKWKSINSIAIPALGCGRGGLSWDSVKLSIQSVLQNVDNSVRILIYEPK